MDLIDRVRDLANRIETQKDHIKTEEAAKTSLVMPFLSALGYDVFNPSEVIPEFIADVGTKKGEKVDYAIKKDGAIIILIECKSLDTDLNKEHASQLFRYFTVTDARFAILTNGAIYRFYSDLEQPNKMDSRPFFEFDIREYKEADIEELKKFSKHTFALDSILETATILKYVRAAKRLLADNMSEPSDEFYRFIISKIYEGRITALALDQFKPIIRSALKQFLEDHVNERLKFALKTTSETTLIESQKPVEPTIAETIESNGIETTEEEIEGYMIIKAILRAHVDVNRIIMRDTKSYCGILLDDNNRKPICRLHFNSSQKYIGLFNVKNSEDKNPINSLNDIYLYADKLTATLDNYK